MPFSSKCFFSIKSSVHLVNLSENSEVKPEEVAAGIGTALLTTATGLMVAIPAMATATVLTRMGKRVYQQFEDAFRQVTIAAGGLRGEFAGAAPAASEEPASQAAPVADGEMPAGEPA